MHCFSNLNGSFRWFTCFILHCQCNQTSVCTVWYENIHVWNRWSPSGPAACRWCWSCRTAPCHSRWCSGPHWTLRSGGEAHSYQGPPEPSEDPQWWCGPDTAPLTNTDVWWVNYTPPHIISYPTMLFSLTFCSTDYNPQLSTHWHTHHLIVMTGQNRTGSWVITCKWAQETSVIIQIQIKNMSTGNTQQ